MTVHNSIAQKPYEDGLKHFTAYIGLTLVLLSFFSTAASGDTQPYWIFFTGRGNIDIEKAVAANSADSSIPKTSSRRARVFGIENIFDERDLPVNPAYIEAVTGSGGAIRTVTRYFNGVSAELDSDALAEIQRLEFVYDVRPVASFHRQVPVSKSAPESPPAVEKTTGLSYGYSFNQLDLINVPDLHEQGYLGKGILIAVLDSGFDGIGHAAFDSLSVAYTRDFVDGDDEPYGHDHGTEVLSVMAALDHGLMIGAAPYADYVLARTEIVENVPNEPDYRVEEDNWVAAIEWADSLGVDVVNSSLGYNIFEGGDGYTWDDLDGNTAITTIAADIAVSKGIVVVTSAGNEGNDAWYYITTPADGFDVLAVGSVDVNLNISAFSSRGPTADGRIKPDFVTLGSSVSVVNTGETEGYNYSQGTSYASPSLAGAAALLLEIHPEWSPGDLRDALRETSIDLGEAGADSLYGWGLADAFAASGLEEPEEPDVVSFRSDPPYPQPLNFTEGDTAIYFPVEVPDAGTVSLKIFTFTGLNVKTVETVYQESGTYENRSETVNWDGTNFTGDEVAPGIYFYTIKFANVTHTGKIAVIR